MRKSSPRRPAWKLCRHYKVCTTDVSLSTDIHGFH